MAEKKIEWGFDLSGFNSVPELNAFMTKHHCKRAGSKTLEVKSKSAKGPGSYSSKYSYYFWECPGFQFTTGHSGRRSSRPSDRGSDNGYLGYIGAEIEPSGMKNWMSFRNEFVKVASVKDESKRRNDFISPPSRMKKQERIRWV